MMAKHKAQRMVGGFRARRSQVRAGDRIVMEYGGDGKWHATASRRDCGSDERAGWSATSLLYWALRFFAMKTN